MRRRWIGQKEWTEEQEADFARQQQELLDETLEKMRNPATTELDVSHILFEQPHLDAIAAELPKTNIKLLRVGRDANDNELKALIDALPASQVEEFYLKGTTTGHQTLKQLQKVLPQTKLIGLRVESYYGTENKDALQKMLSVLPQTKLRKLEITCQEFSDEDAKTLVDNMPSDLEELTLQGQRMTAEGSKALFDGLPDGSLKKLDLTFVKIDEAGAESLAKKLQTNPLQELRLWSSNLNKDSCAKLAEGLCDSSVRCLDVGSNRPIGPEGAKALASVFDTMPIEELRIDQCNIGGIGVKAIAEQLPHCPIKTLQLYATTLGEMGAEALGKALPSSQIEGLFLNGCVREKSHFSALVEGLVQSPIQILSIERAGLAKAGEEVAYLLRNSSLSYLNLQNCGLRTEDFEVIAEALPVSNLNHLKVHENNGGKAGFKALAKAIPNSPIVRCETFKSEDEKEQEAIKEMYRAANANLNRYWDLGYKIWREPKKMTDEEYADAARNASAIRYLSKFEWKMAEGDSNQDRQLSVDLMRTFFVAATSNRSATQGPIPAQTLIEAAANLGSLEDAKRVAAGAGIKMKAADLLEPDGSISPNRFLCQGGISRLLSESAMWDSSSQMSHAISSLPEFERDKIPNRHQIVSNFSRNTLSETRGR